MSAVAIETPFVLADMYMRPRLSNIPLFCVIADEVEYLFSFDDRLLPFAVITKSTSTDSALSIVRSASS